MTLETLKSRLGDYAKDIRLNLDAVLSEEGAPGLSQTQIHATALSSAYATRNPTLIQLVEAETATSLSEADRNAARAAATIMAMNNIYYRFLDLVEDEEFGKLPANLRMNVLKTHGVKHEEFELYALAVSAINGCSMCVRAHVRPLEKAGFTKQSIQSAVRIAAVIQAAAQALLIAEHAQQELAKAA
jgi:alkyl hydroperoxide reductase subunit D